MYLYFTSTFSVLTTRSAGMLCLMEDAVTTPGDHKYADSLPIGGH